MDATTTLFCLFVLLSRFGSAVIADELRFSASTIKVGLSSDPIVNKPNDVLCNVSLIDLQRASENWAHLKEWKCSWSYYRHDRYFNDRSRRDVVYNVALNENNYKGDTIICNYHFLQLELLDDGVYKCQFFVPDGDLGNRTVVESDALELSVYYAPTGETKIAMSSHLDSLQAGMSANLTCSVDPSQVGNPPAIYNWRQIGNLSFSHRGSVLSLVRMKESAWSTPTTYECVPENQAGKGSLVAVDVVVRPSTFLTFTDAVTNLRGSPAVMNDSSVKLTCLAVGYPRFSLHWCQESEQDCTNITQIKIKSAENDVIQNSSQIERSYRYSERVSRIVPLPSSRGQEGDWSCLALRSRSNGTEIVKQRSIYLAGKRGPEFLLNDTVVHGTGALSTATLHCEAVGHPRPDLIWFVEDELGNLVRVESSKHVTVGFGITSSDSDKISRNLVISNVTKDDSQGRYICTSANNLGRIQMKFTFNPTNLKGFSDRGLMYDQLADSWSTEVRAVVYGLCAVIVIMMLVSVVSLVCVFKARKERVAVAVVATTATQCQLDEQPGALQLYDLPGCTEGMQYVRRSALNALV